MWKPLCKYWSFLRSVRWGRDKDHSSEESLTGETAADAVNTSWPEEIHQVSLYFCNPENAFFIPSVCSPPSHHVVIIIMYLLYALVFTQVFPLFFGFRLYTSYGLCTDMLCTVCHLQNIKSWHIFVISLSLMSVCVIVYQNFILHLLTSVFLSLFSECSQRLSAFCCPTLLFLFLFFSLPWLSFPVFSLHPSVHSYLWSFPIYYC